jgi:hypothetical protein
MNKIEKENTDYKNFLNEVLQQIENAKFKLHQELTKLQLVYTIQLVD